MYSDIYHFVASWVPSYARDNRNTLPSPSGHGGAPSLGVSRRAPRATFASRYQVLIRTREL